MSFLPKQNLVGYWPLDGYSADMSRTKAVYDTIAFDASSNGIDAVVSHTCSGNNRMLLISIMNGGSTDDITSVTYNGVACTRISAGVLVPSDNYLHLFALINPDSGAHNIVVTATGGSSYIAAASYTGVNQTTFPYTYATSTGTGVTSKAYSITTVTANSWTILSHRSGAAQWTASAGSTQRVTSAANSIFDSNGVVSVGANSMSVSGSYQNVGGVIAAIEPALLTYTTGNNNGTVTGALPVPSQNPAIPASLAYKFNGTTDKISMPNSSVYSFSTDYTLLAWIYPTSTSAVYKTIITKRNGATTTVNYELDLDTTNTLVLYDGAVRSSGKVIPINQWSFVAISGGSTAQFYYNGRFLASTAITKTPNTYGLNIGGLIGDQSQNFFGSIQEVAIFNKALSAQEIQAIYNQSKAKYRSSKTGRLYAIISAIRTSDFFQFFLK